MLIWIIDMHSSARFQALIFYLFMVCFTTFCIDLTPKIGAPDTPKIEAEGQKIKCFLESWRHLGGLWATCDWPWAPKGDPWKVQAWFFMNSGSHLGGQNRQESVEERSLRPFCRWKCDYWAYFCWLVFQTCFWKVKKLEKQDFWRGRTFIFEPPYSGFAVFLLF